MNTEIWKPIPGYEGCYEASSTGLIREAGTGAIMRTSPQSRGYLRVRLRAGGKRREHLCHRLIAAAFIGDCPPGHQVNHKDLNKMNNAPDNLEYMTHLENIQHAVKAGAFSRVNANDHGKAVLTDGEVNEIRSLAGTATHAQLAERYGVARSTITHILLRYKWNRGMPLGEPQRTNKPHRKFPTEVPHATP